MNLKKRIYAIIIVAAVLTGILYVGKSGLQLSQEAERESFLSNNKKKDTLQFWYTDESLTDYLNAAAVQYNETYGTRVELTLMSEMEVLEAINTATLDDEAATPDRRQARNTVPADKSSAGRILPEPPLAPLASWSRKIL